MKRADDIKQKLAFSLLKHNNLHSEIDYSQKNDADIAFIGQKVGDILSGCRECFDYCAKDMAETFVLQSANQNMVSRYFSGKAKAYFPFFPTQLLNGTLFYELTATAPELYAHLFNLAHEIEEKKIIPGTVIGYDVCKTLNEIVNDKKHDQITVARIRDNAATRISFSGGTEITISPMFPFTDRPDFSADIDAEQMIGSDGVQIKYVREYRLYHNNWEVERFCLHSIQATKFILSDIYQNFFRLSRDYFDPWETIKPEDVKSGEALLRSISPINNRPLRVVLLLDDVESANIKITFEGYIEATDATYISLARLFMFIFEKYFQYFVKLELEKYIMENWKKFDSKNHTPRYFEMVKSFHRRKIIVINEFKRIEFNKILFGIGSKFCCNENILLQQEMDIQSMQSAIAIINSSTENFALYTDASGQVIKCCIL
ncbi:hypothetical protein M2352_002214 [Azospirillum fermentarium]|uniref:hypothetical protein n=1 Tax=Azospirillum fermentarium TaxID=1233114 RepID=UPI002227002B|nr:hypothetical protein [Azospirillum fermentarium]MCW2246623.1 hypothetical protein [Azospirillum fermentarium]